MEHMNNLKDIEKKAKKKTKSFILIGLVLWMGFLFFFLNQSRNEHSLVFAQKVPKWLGTKTTSTVNIKKKNNKN